MQELIQRLMQQANLSQGQAQNVLSVAMNFIRSRVPALAPLMGMFGGGATTTTTTTSATAPAQQGGGLIGDVERMFGGGNSPTTTTTTSATTSTPAPGAMPAGIQGALGNLFNNGGPLHQELVQNAGLNQSQAAASTNVIQSFITQHIPAASSMMQEGSALDNVEDRVDGMFGIKDNNTNPGA